MNEILDFLIKGCLPPVRWGQGKSRSAERRRLKSSYVRLHDAHEPGTRIEMSRATYVVGEHGEYRRTE